MLPDLVERLDVFDVAYTAARTCYRESRSADHLRAVETVEAGFEQWLRLTRSVLARERRTDLLPEINWWLTTIDNERRHRASTLSRQR